MHYYTTLMSVIDTDSNVLINIHVCFAVSSSWPFFFLSNHLHLRKTNKPFLLLVLCALLPCLSFSFFFLVATSASGRCGWSCAFTECIIFIIIIITVLVFHRYNLHNLSFKLSCSWIMHIYLLLKLFIWHSEHKECFSCTYNLCSMIMFDSDQILCG